MARISSILALIFTVSSPVLAAAVVMASLSALSGMSDEQLQKFDIGYVNLCCAADLPGAQGLDLDLALKKLDYMAAWVGRETAKNLYRYHREPAKFEKSEARFKAGMMVTVLALDFRCKYNPSRGSDPKNPEPAVSFYADSRDLFVHGFLSEQHAYGTCASFPVLFAAVGRRLGYPIKLVTTKTHLFCRWEGATDRFNIEGTHGGMKIHPDDYYKKWPFELDEESIKANGHLVSKSPKEELADFLSIRASCLLAHGRKDEAKEAMRMACNLAPGISYYKRLHDHLSRSITQTNQP